MFARSKLRTTAAVALAASIASAASGAADACTYILMHRVEPNRIILVRYAALDVVAHQDPFPAVRLAQVPAKPEFPEIDLRPGMAKE